MEQIYLQARSFCHIIYCTSQCMPIHTVYFLSVLAHTETLLGLLLLGDVTDSTGVVQALVARRRSRLRHQRKLYNNWQTTKLRFRSLISSRHSACLSPM